MAGHDDTEHDHDTVVHWDADPDLFPRFQRALDLLGKDKEEEAVAEFLALAERGSSRAMMQLGWQLEVGEGSSPNLTEVEQWYRRAAAGGAIDAHYYLGDLLWRQHRFDEAYEAFRAGTELGHVLSISRLASMLFRGEGAVKNLGQARKLWERASAMGHMPSRRHLGIYSLQGRFGFSRIPVGLPLLWSAMTGFLSVLRRNPDSDLLRQ
ncbi:MAG TPA: tetratricopeptide repeat protein [Caulobacteraceae bacterium]|jgi:TPR repeat protein